MVAAPGECEQLLPAVLGGLEEERRAGDCAAQEDGTVHAEGAALAGGRRAVGRAGRGRVRRPADGGRQFGGL
eukprot:9525758-Lingulodinium_polyedra.AAC.1